MKKIIQVLVIIFIISVSLSNYVYAAIGSENIFDIGKEWTDTGKPAEGDTTTTNTDDLYNASNQLFNIFFDLGIGVVIIVGAFLGIKFMTAGVEEKAEIKKTLIPYVISSVVLVGAYGIWRLSILVLKDLTSF